MGRLGRRGGRGGGGPGQSGLQEEGGAESPLRFWSFQLHLHSGHSCSVGLLQPSLSPLALQSNQTPPTPGPPSVSASTARLHLTHFCFPQLHSGTKAKLFPGNFSRAPVWRSSWRSSWRSRETECWFLSPTDLRTVSELSPPLPPCTREREEKLPAEGIKISLRQLLTTNTIIIPRPRELQTTCQADLLSR